jgi:pyrimidine-nucleoside phosphorylase
LSKKVAEGTDSLVMDIKVGSGAFMKTREQAKRLAKTLTSVAKKMGLPCRALLTDMSQPLGYSVGNALEIRESIEVLKNEKRGDLTSIDLKELTLTLCSHMLEVSGHVKTIAQGRKLATQKLKDGSAWEVFLKLVKAQGGDVQVIEDPSRLWIATNTIPVKAKKRSFITQMDTEAIGKLLIELGGGRRRASDVIDPSTGIEFHRKLGARVQPGEVIATIYAPSGLNGDELQTKLLQTITFGGTRKSVAKLIMEQI